MISIKNLNYTMQGNPVMSDFSLEAGKGEKHLIIGKSGSGKTSLFRVLLGFASPDAGSIHINGLALDKDHIGEIRNLIFYLSQDVDLPHETCKELMARILRLNRESALGKDEMDKFLSLLALEPKILEKNISILSGGERQRLGLLMGFMLNRPIWLLDEPTSALDDAMKKTVADHIMTLDKTVVIVSHDPVWKEQPGMITMNWS